MATSLSPIRTRGRSLNYLSYDDAKAFARRLKLKSEKDWTIFCEGFYPSKPLCPETIPKAPYAYYQNRGWISWGDFLGTHRIATYKQEFVPFDQARLYAQSLQLKNSRAWNNFCKGGAPEKGSKPSNIPNDPAHQYRGDGWISWADFLSTNNISTSKRRFLPYHTARQFVVSLNLKTQGQWRQYIKDLMPHLPKRPPNVPKSPHHTYESKGWINFHHWLGGDSPQ